MAEPWIRVHANIAEKKVAIRAADYLGISLNEAIGTLVRFWGAMSRLGNDGQVEGMTDGEIETWGGWRRKRGAFAAFIRELHTDPEGRVNEWDDYAGVLEDRRAKDRDRQKRRRELRRQSRGQSADSHAERPRDVTQESVPARAVRNETIRNEKISSSPARPISPEEEALADRLPSEAGKRALHAICAASPSPVAWVAEMGASLDGMAGHVYLTPEQLDTALREYEGNGALKSPSFKHFRQYLSKASEPTTAATGNGARTSSRAPTPGEQSYAAGAAALGLIDPGDDQ